MSHVALHDQTPPVARRRADAGEADGVIGRAVRREGDVAAIAIDASAAALDYVWAIKKTPIVVNDSRGFFANRCVTAYLREGHLMLAEGVPPANAASLESGAPGRNRSSSSVRTTVRR